MRFKHATIVLLPALLLFLLTACRPGTPDAIPSVPQEAYEYLSQITAPEHLFCDDSGILWYGHSVDIRPKAAESVFPFAIDNTEKASLEGAAMEVSGVDGDKLILRLHNNGGTGITVTPYVRLEVKLSDGWYGYVPRPEIIYFDVWVGPGESYDAALILSADTEGHYPLPSGRYRASVSVNDGYVYTEFDLNCTDGVYSAVEVTEG